MKMWKNNQGYFSIYVKGTGKIMLHRYVWELYNGPIADGMEVHHKNENKSCNCIANLEIMTRKEHVNLHLKELSKAETFRRYGLPNVGRKMTVEDRAKISRSKLGVKRDPAVLRKAWVTRKANKKYHEVTP